MSAPASPSLLSRICALAKPAPIVALLLVLAALSLTACGRKPSVLDAPDSGTTYTYPPAAP